MEIIWTIKKATYRAFQTGMKVGSYFLDWREPTLLKGAGSIKKLPDEIKKLNISSVLIVTDKVIEDLQLMDPLLEGLSTLGIEYVIFNGVQPNPSIENIEDARKLYVDNNCGGIIAFGGGSPMDCAKIAGARVANPRTPVKRMRGFLKIWRKLPPVFAVPTTAGTGSESTITAVAKDMKTYEKYAVTDPKMRPRYAVLDPELTLGLPPKITATTGMDALTHAVEAYTNKGNTKHTAECARKAVKLIFENLETAYTNGSDIVAREQMLIASNYAGLAFTRSYVGYVHAIAHTIGGLYDTPHGLANAVILPHVLEFYGEIIHQRLAELADIAGVTTPDQDDSEKATVFIAAIKGLNNKMGIPEHLEGIKEDDIPLIVKRVLKEANLHYPVPYIMNEAECEVFIRKLRI